MKNKDNEKGLLVFREPDSLKIMAIHQEIGFPTGIVFTPQDILQWKLHGLTEDSVIAMSWMKLFGHTLYEIPEECIH